jgi:hypothetical protein
LKNKVYYIVSRKKLEMAFGKMTVGTARFEKRKKERKRK